MSKLYPQSVVGLLLAIGFASASIHADDDSPAASIGDAKQILKILGDSHQRKAPLLPESGTVFGDHSVSCRLDIPERWRVSISLSNNRRYAFLIFPCTNPDKTNQEIYKRLMIENRRMGLMRFEYSPSNNLISLVYPVTNRNLDFDALDDMTRLLVDEARRTESLWSKSKQLATNKAASQRQSTDSIESDEEDDDTDMKKDAGKSESSEKGSMDTPKTRKGESSRNQKQLAEILHERLRSGFTAEYTFKNGKKEYQGVIEFKQNGTYRVKSSSDQPAKSVSGKWMKNAGGMILAEKDGDSNDIFQPLEINNGRLKVTFRYGVPTRAASASAPVPSTAPKSTYFREFTFDLKAK